MRRRAPRTSMTSFALGIGLLILGIQVYLFETVLGTVLDGNHSTTGWAFVVSLVLSASALFLAFKAPGLDR